MDHFTGGIPAIDACEHLMTAIQGAIIPFNGNQINITVSIGLAEASSEIIEWSEILKRADELLYDAKANGRNRIVVDGEHGKKLVLAGR